MSPLFGKSVCSLAVAFVACQVLAPRLVFGQSTELSTRFEREAQPLLKQYCLGCHSTEKQKGDLDLERFTSAAEVLRHAKIWQGVVEQIGLGEMPPKEKPQLTSIERERLLSWVNLALDEAARARAGDPGPVVLRR
ncbi:MAG TPA: c-type cytochrome domain-containing protein, partial [Verrucomicrobiae bacterium]|nr:c-type cytochrome domain-containing protein [Verrucomicrobiae bacterium]